MAAKFNSGLIEYTGVIHGHLVHIYKAGGGTFGRRYTGLWGYRIRYQGHVLASGEDLYTGTPVTHDEAAVIAVDIAEKEE